MQNLLDKIEKYGFQCDGGNLTNCKEWLELKHLASCDGCKIEQFAKCHSSKNDECVRIKSSITLEK